MTKIYLGTPWFNEVQKKRATLAQEALSKNPTVDIFHFPFAHQYKDATVEDQKDGIFGSLEWQIATYENDMTAIGSSDMGVFLYDADNPDEGSTYEMGVLRGDHKPVITVLFTEKTSDKPELNLMIARGTTTFIDQEDWIKELETFDFQHPMSNPIPSLKVF